MVNSGIKAEDFNFPLDDWGQTVNIVTVSTTSNVYGDEVLTNASNSNVTAIVKEITRGSRTWDKLGYIEELDALIYVKPNITLNINDLVIANNKTFRVKQPRVRRAGGVAIYNTAAMALYDTEEAENMGLTVSYGDGAPTSTPAGVGDIYIDTTNDIVYIATGTSSSTDWKQVLST